MHSIRLTLILVIVLLISHAVYSQSISDSVFQIGQVNITAEQVFNKEEAGMKETEVDSMVLQEKANLSLSDLLAENTPVYIKNHGRGALATASFRGTDASHTQVNWNGMNINSPMTGMVDFSMIPVYIIDEMSLKHGTASIENQSGGLGGAINIKNKVNWEKDTRVKYIQGIGSYQTFDEFLQAGTGNKKIRSTTRLYHNYSKNNFTYVNKRIGNIDPKTGKITHPLDTNKNADYTRYGGMQELYFRPNTNNVLSLKWWGQWSDRTLPRPTSYEGPENANLNNQNTVDHKVMARWKQYGKKDKLSLRAGYSIKDMKYVHKNRVPGKGMLPAVYSVSKQQSSLNQISYEYEIDKSFSIETSLDANFHDVTSQDTVRNNGYEKQRRKMSGLLSLQKSFGDRLNTKLMIREDWVDDQFVPLVPYLGFDFRLLEEKKIYLKGNIARNYHQPSLNDLYWQPGGNPDLLPEKGFSTELGAEYKLSTDNFHLSSDLTVYRSDINNWIIWVPSYKGYWEPRNVKRVLSRGMEFGLQVTGKISEVSYHASGNYAWTRSLNYGDKNRWGNESYGKQLVYVPVHSGNLLIKLSWNKFFLTYQHNSYSERYTTSSNDVTQRDWLYPYFMNNLGMGKSHKFDNFSLSGKLKVYNLFDESYHSVLHTPMPGRNYMLVFMLKF
jgi:iron complex outermembrane receptor protein